MIINIPGYIGGPDKAHGPKNSIPAANISPYTNAPRGIKKWTKLSSRKKI